MTQAPDALELAALLCSRVCHDVVNPVGAIINGLEVLDDGDDPELGAVALDLIRKSADQASTKLQFARLAYGAASAAGASIDLGDACAVAQQFVGGDKHTLEWRLPRQTVPKDEAKLVLNLILVGLATTPRGGTIIVDGVLDHDRMTSVELRCVGDNARIPDEVERFVTGRGHWSEVSSHGIQPYFAGLIAAAVDMDVTFEWPSDTIVIRADKRIALTPEVVPETESEADSDDAVISFATMPLKSS